MMNGRCILQPACEQQNEVALFGKVVFRKPET
jgi:hypothetical protein